MTKEKLNKNDYNNLIKWNDKIAVRKIFCDSVNCKSIKSTCDTGYCQMSNFLSVKNIISNRLIGVGKCK